MTTPDVRDQLAQAMRERLLMRFHRRFEDGWVRGYVVGIGPEFLMLCEVSDHLRFNGFGCYRLADVKNLQPAPYPEFVEAALEKLGQVQPETPAVALNSIDDIVTTAGNLFTVITAYTEAEVHIGAVVSLDGGVVWMRDIGPDAAWSPQPSARRLDDLTRIDFGGAYETALTLVGGPPPAPVEAPLLRLVSDNG
uniref:hypothetical protein n=1 Tax=uncultured Caulobacter sp. TaxID=158749 RepID=UPI0025D09ADF|nr:hypothetical protein [uncultured Caulobacter sp.]